MVWIFSVIYNETVHKPVRLMLRTEVIVQSKSALIDVVSTTPEFIVHRDAPVRGTTVLIDWLEGYAYCKRRWKQERDVSVRIYLGESAG